MARRVGRLELRIKAERDWMALNIYRMALEHIVKRGQESPWDFSGEEAAAIAEHVIREFPGSFKR